MYDYEVVRKVQQRQQQKKGIGNYWVELFIVVGGKMQFNPGPIISFSSLFPSFS